MTGQQIAIAREQFDELQALHKALELVREGEKIVIQGELGFTIDHNGHSVSDTYTIRLELDDGFPERPPLAFEPRDAVDRSIFDHKFIDGSLCLAASAEVKRQYNADPTLLGFVNRLLVPYLFSHSYKRDYGELPHGELRHGARGVRDYYLNHFKTDLFRTLLLLHRLTRPAPLSTDAPCPCRSGRPLGHCHRAELEGLWGQLTPEEYREEYDSVLRNARRDPETKRIIQSCSRLLPSSISS